MTIPPEPTPDEGGFPGRPVYCHTTSYSPDPCHEKTGKLSNLTLGLLIANTVLLLLIFGMLLGK